MGYLDSTSITVDAILTKKGREILKNGGTLNIDSFTASDTGVDYTLWNPSDTTGSAYYGAAIENLPNLEANVHAEYNLRNRLITLNQDTIAIPALEISGLTSTNTLTFANGDTAGIDLTAIIKGFTTAATGNAVNAGAGIYIVIQDPSIVTTNATFVNGLSGTTRMFLREQDIAHARQYKVNGGSPYNFKMIPDTEQTTTGRQTNVYLVHIETGAYASFTVVNDISRLRRELLTTKTIG